MKKESFIFLFIAVNLFFIFFQIYKNSKIIKVSFEKQRNEKLKEELINHKITLSQQLCALQNKAEIKQYAVDTLQMEKIKLHNLKKLPAHED